MRIWSSSIRAAAAGSVTHGRRCTPAHRGGVENSRHRPRRAVGLVGDPTVELVAAIQGAWLAGRSVSILPGPVRGSDPQQWAQATRNRFSGIGVDTVFSHGGPRQLLDEPGAGITVHDVTAAATEPSTGFATVTAAPDVPAVLQGTAGSTGTPAPRGCHRRRCWPTSPD